MKRVFTLLAALLVAGACFATAEREAPATISGIVNPAGTFPIVNEKITLRVAMEDQGAPDYDTNWFTKHQEERTNIHVSWELLPYDKSMEKANLIIASGDLPDVFIAVRFTKEDVFRYAQEGVFVPIERLIDSYAVNQMRLYQQETWLSEAQVFPDGHKYSLDSVQPPGVHVWYYGKMWMNESWVRKVGLQMPTTTEQFAQVLKAFKEKDPNGNGKQDEIPLTGATRWMELPHLFLMNAFIYNDGRSYLRVQNGKVDLVANKPEWKAGLEYMRKLFVDGLIDPGAFTQERAQSRLLLDAEPMRAGAFPSHHPGNMMSYSKEGHKQFVTVAPLKGPAGVQLAGMNDQRFLGSATGGFFVVTKAAKHPEAAVRWADDLLSMDTSLLALNGPEGKHWRKAAAGELNLDGKQASFAIIDYDAAKNNEAWGSGFANKGIDNLLGAVVDFSDPWNLDVRLFRETKKYQAYGPSFSTVYPDGLLFVDPEQMSEKAQLATVVNGYVLESMTRFIYGDLSIQNDWDKYVRELGNMGLQRYLGILQAAYDKKYKK